MRRVALLLVLAAACAPGTQSGPAPAAMVTLPGSYTVNLSDADLATAPEGMRQAVNGTWVLQFHDGNHYVATRNGMPAVEGAYRIEGNQLVLAVGESGPMACNLEATYTWQVSNGQLTLTPVDDGCMGRRVTITSRAWTRTP
jgi:hypothetical protein